MPWKKILTEISQPKKESVHKKFIELALKLYKKGHPEFIDANFDSEEDAHKFLSEGYGEWVNVLMGYDPTDTGKYAEHFYRLYKNQIKIEVSRLFPIHQEKAYIKAIAESFRSVQKGLGFHNLKKYEEIKDKKFPEEIEKYKDFGKFKTVGEFDEFMNSRAFKSFVFRNNVEGGADKIAEDDTYIVYHVKNFKASCEIAKHTKLCTASGGDGDFKHFTEQGKLLTFVNKKISGKYGDDGRYNNQDKILQLHDTDHHGFILTFKNGANESVKYSELIPKHRELFLQIVNNVELETVTKLIILISLYKKDVRSMEKYLDDREKKMLGRLLKSYIEKISLQDIEGVVRRGNDRFIVHVDVDFNTSMESIDFTNPYSIFLYYKLWKNSLEHQIDVPMQSIYNMVYEQFKTFLFESDDINESLSAYLGDVVEGTDIEKIIFQNIKEHGELQFFDIMEDNGENTNISLEEPADMKYVSFKSVLDYLLETNPDAYEFIVVAGVLKPYMKLLIKYDELKSKKLTKQLGDVEIAIEKIDLYDTGYNQLEITFKSDDKLGVYHYLLNTIQSTINHSGVPVSTLFSDILEDAYNDSDFKEVFDMENNFDMISNHLKEQINEEYIIKYISRFLNSAS